MMRYFVHRIGPGHALGLGCAVGVIMGLLPVLGLVAAALVAQSYLDEVLQALGPWAAPLAAQVGVSWKAVGLAGLVLLLAFAVIYGLGAWLAALGFNLVARVSGGLALDIRPDAFSELGEPSQPDLERWEPTVPLARPRPLASPAAAFPAVSSQASELGTPPPPLPPAATPSATQPWLVSETDATGLWALNKPTTTIGSDPVNDVALAGDPQVAPWHAEIRAESSGYVLYDLGSPQGSFVNGWRVQGRNLLKDGFRIQFGETGLLFRRGV